MIDEATYGKIIMGQTLLKKTKQKEKSGSLPLYFTKIRLHG
jgi:hypothetical protein